MNSSIPLNPEFVKETSAFIYSLRDDLSVQRSLKESNVILLTKIKALDGEEGGIREKSELLFTPYGLILNWDVNNNPRHWVLFPAGEGIVVQELTVPVKDVETKKVKTRDGDFLGDRPIEEIAAVEAQFLLMEKLAEHHRRLGVGLGGEDQILDPEITDALIEEREVYKESRIKEHQNASLEGNLVSFPENKD